MPTPPAEIPSRRRLKFTAAGIVIGTLLGSIVVTILRHKDLWVVVGAVVGSLIAVTVLYFGTRPPNNTR